jgi:hypothetical protein
LLSVLANAAALTSDGSSELRRKLSSAIQFFGWPTYLLDVGGSAWGCAERRTI